MSPSGPISVMSKRFALVVVPRALSGRAGLAVIFMGRVANARRRLATGLDPRKGAR